MVMLSVIDSNWKEYLREIDDLREGISWRAYAQKDPLVEYKKESYNLFQELQQRADEEVIKFLFLFQPVEEEELEDWKKKKQMKMVKPIARMPGKHHKKKKKKKRR